MKVTILGCGGSFGAPQINCNCRVCTGGDPLNSRSRASILVENTATSETILVDTSTDLREQALRNKIAAVDHIIITHKHADHTSGIDDVKPFSYAHKERLPLYCTQETYDSIASTYQYLFETQSKLYRPLLKKHIVEYDTVLSLAGLKIELFRQHHGEIDSLGIIFNDTFAYMTDFHALPSKSLDLLKSKNLDVAIVDCLKYSSAPSHCYYETAMYYIDKIKPKRTILTHSSHEMDYNELKAFLPSNIEPAYDGMVITI